MEIIHISQQLCFNGLFIFKIDGKHGRINELTYQPWDLRHKGQSKSQEQVTQWDQITRDTQQSGDAKRNTWSEKLKMMITNIWTTSLIPRVYQDSTRFTDMIQHKIIYIQDDNDKWAPRFYLCSLFPLSAWLWHVLCVSPQICLVQIRLTMAGLKQAIRQKAQLFANLQGLQGYT